jgi:hypothetical protein
MIGLIKQQLWRTFEGKKLTHEETLTILAEAVQKINSRPLTWNPRPEGEPLCVQDLMLGRAKPGQAEVKFESGKKLTKRFENVQRTQQEFWKRWIEEVFPEKLKQSKWKREKRDLRVGDIVLRKDETAAGQTYKYAKVVKVYVSSDNKVRAADVEYKLPGESVFRTTTRPIHKLVLVIPVEEQGPAVDQAKGVQGSPSSRSTPPGGRAASTGAGRGNRDHGSGPTKGGCTGCTPNGARSRRREGPHSEPPPSEQRRGGATRPQAQESDFQKEGGQADTGHHRDDAEGGG